MSLFAFLADPDSLPEPAASFVRERREWLRRCWGTTGENGRWYAYGEATRALRSELAARGGSWAVNGLVFSLDPSGAIVIEEASS